MSAVAIIHNRLTTGGLALFECLIEAFTETQVGLVGGAVEELFDLKVTRAGLGWRGPGGLL